MGEHQELREYIYELVQEATKDKEKAQEISDLVMDKISQDFRSITEIHGIVETIRAGMTVQIDYYDEELDDNEYIYRSCW